MVAGNLLLKDTDAAIDLVRNLNLALDRELNHEDAKVDARPTGMAAIDDWKVAYVARGKHLLRAWGTGVLDELTLLEQRLTERRRAAAVEAATPPPISPEPEPESELAEHAIPTRDFFISYTHVDQEWALWIARVLEEAGYTVVVQARDFLPGENFPLEMDAALRETRATVAVLSAAYLQSPYCLSEISATFARDPDGHQRALIPVRVGECRPEGLLRGIIFTDLVGFDRDAARARLLDTFSDRSGVVRSARFPGLSSSSG